MPDCGKTMWELSLSSDIQLEYDFGMCGIGMDGTSSSHLRVKCDLDKAFQYRNETVDTDLQSQGNAHVGDKDAGDGTAEPDQGKATIDYLRLSRRFDTGLPRFTVDDNPSSKQPKNSLYFDVQINTSMRVECHVNFPGAENPPPQSYPCPMVVQFDVPYDPTPDSLQNKKDLAEWIQRFLKTAPVPGKINNAKGIADYSLKKKRLELKYGPTDTDVAVAKYSGNVAFNGDKHVCYDEKTKTSWLVHSNMEGRVMIDGEEQPKGEFLIWRLARSWKIDAKGKNISSHGKAGPGEGAVLERGWTFDSAEPVDDWTDNAGVSWTSHPNRWTGQGVITEFLVGVLNYPEFGFIYTAFVGEIKKNAYRIAYSGSKPVDLKTAQKIYQSTKPQFKSPFTNRTQGWVSVKP